MINFELNEQKEVVFDGRVYAGVDEDSAQLMYTLSVKAAKGNEDALKKAFAKMLAAIVGTVKSVVKDAQAEIRAAVELASQTDKLCLAHKNTVKQGIAKFVEEVRGKRIQFGAKAIVPVKRSEGNFTIVLADASHLDAIVAEYGDAEAVWKDSMWRVVVNDPAMAELAKPIMAAKQSYQGRMTDIGAENGLKEVHVDWDDEGNPILKSTPGMTGRTSLGGTGRTSLGGTGTFKYVYQD